MFRFVPHFDITISISALLRIGPDVTISSQSRSPSPGKKHDLIIYQAD